MQIRATRIGALLGLLMAASVPATAANLPAGFAETRVATGLTNVTTMAIAPDGRVFVSEQAGRLRVIKNDVLLASPAITLSVDTVNERGLMGIAFDPNFASNQLIYIYYTVPNPTPDPAFPNLGAHNRVSRFVMNGDVVNASTEQVLMDFPDLGTAPIHNAGALHFGPDGKLYISVGDNYNFSTPQSLATPLGKMLRINADGTIPSDNPFVGVAGANPAIWAYGLRNPFTFAIQPTTGRIFANDVGDKLYDEINDIVKGANYGWPETEGPHNNPAFQQPFFYTAWSSQNCTTIGAAFYNPATRDFPGEFEGKYFFGDLCGNYIKVMDPATAQVQMFATGLSPIAPAQPTSQLVDLDVSPDGKLYYLNRAGSANNSSVWKIYHGHSAPTISAHPSNQLVSDGETVTFSCSGSGAAPLAYRWQRNGIDIAGSSSSTYSFVVNMGDNGATFACVVSNEFGEAVSNAATLTVTSNMTPNVTILSPTVGATYQGGSTIYFEGDAYDAEEGSLPASAFTWTVSLQHADHQHPALGPVSGIKLGSYTVPTIGETDTNVRFLVTLSVRDSAGLVRTVTREVMPEISTFTITSNVPGTTIRLDGQPRKTPITVSGVIGIERSIAAATHQEQENLPVWFEFQGWSDGGAPTHTISTPATPTTYTAFFNRVDTPECITFETLSRFINMPFPTQTGSFSLEFDATATAFPANANIGISDGPRGGLPGQAAMLIFNSNGRLQGRGLTGGQADVVFNYQANVTYHARMEIRLSPDPAAVPHMYDLYISAPGVPEFRLASNLRFRVEHALVTQLNNWGVFASPVPASGGTVRVCRFSVNCSNEKNTPPVVTAPADITVSASANACSRVVTDAELGTAKVGDNCKFGLSGVTRSGVPAGNVFPVGTTLVSYSATDGAGLTTTVTQKVTVVDDTPPTISGVSATPNVLWPPNHKLVTVNVGYTAADACGTVQTVLSAKSNQPLGIFRPDWIVVDNHTVKLRAERSLLGALFGHGRTYTVTIDAVDGAGNVSSQDVLVTVPAHNHHHTGNGCRHHDHHWDSSGD